MRLTGIATRESLFATLVLTLVILVAFGCGETSSNTTADSSSTSSATETLDSSLRSQTQSPPAMAPTVLPEPAARQAPSPTPSQVSIQPAKTPTSVQSPVGEPTGEPASKQTERATVTPNRGDVPTLSLRDSATAGLALTLLGEIRIVPEHDSGYSRDDWRHWIDSDGDGCDTRQEVLETESIEPVSHQTGRCRVSDGAWISPYDNQDFTNPSDLDIDHLVPLAEAHESGGWAWDSDTRRAYANDLSDARHLIAVSATSNRSKGAKDPNNWLPSNESYHCQYVSDWIAVKYRWTLAMDESEFEFLTELLSGKCEGLQISLSNQNPRVDTVNARQSVTSAAPQTPVTTSSPASSSDCHPAYEPCLPNRPGDALNCSDLSSSQKPVRVKVIGVDPYKLDRDNNGSACTS